MTNSFSGSFFKKMVVVLAAVGISSPGLSATLEEKVDALTSEIANLKEQMAVPVKAGASHTGLGPGASKVYFSNSPVSIGGYGEIIFQDEQGGNGDVTDALRMVPYFGYRFSDNIIFNAELEVEHGAVSESGDVALEFAYIDFLLNEYANIRVGHLLAPIGITNKLHEPTLFPTVNRPEVEKNIIPTTWHENGLIVYGSWLGVSYEIGTITAFDAASFSDSSFVRGGRQKGSKAKAVDWALVARLDYKPLNWLEVGYSFYSSSNDQGNPALGTAQLTLWETHLMIDIMGFETKALFAEGALDDSDLVSTATGKTVGSIARGYYVNLAYDIFRLIDSINDKKLKIFVQFEEYDTHFRVAGGATADPTNNRRRATVGVNFFPESNIVVKADYVFRETQAGAQNDLFELGIGWVY